MKFKANNLFILSLSLNFILIAIPVSLYIYFTYKGVLTSEINWQGNHGPWLSSWIRGYIYYPLLLLMAFIPINFLIGIIVYLKSRSIIEFFKGFGLAIISTLLVTLHLLFIYWTID